ncbi:MAG: CYTH domain-containing protein [Candidatus Aenigmarchaeota archaeon]|nr:CYTH domain-containing protein [Candidatus Aenigmarchaeota archaeon]
MGQEIERKFLIGELPSDLNQYSHKELTQGYVEITDNSEERVRQKEDRYFHTIKTSSGLSREENEKEITEDEYESGLKNAGDKIVEKTRYKIPYNGKTIELDIYHGKLNGLVTAEIEFDSVKESETFKSPDWFRKEVTEDKRYKNQSLAVFGIPSRE